jgi:hypothetical protein
MYEYNGSEDEVEVTLRLTVSQYVSVSSTLEVKKQKFFFIYLNNNVWYVRVIGKVHAAYFGTAVVFPMIHDICMTIIS